MAPNTGCTKYWTKYWMRGQGGLKAAPELGIVGNLTGNRLQGSNPLRISSGTSAKPANGCKSSREPVRSLRTAANLPGNGINASAKMPLAATRGVNASENCQRPPPAVSTPRAKRRWPNPAVSTPRAKCLWPQHVALTDQGEPLPTPSRPARSPQPGTCPPSPRRPRRSTSRGTR